MPQTLKNNGDLFERSHHEWLNSKLPGYEFVWQAVIGNDGNNQPLPLPKSTPELERARKQFYQSHYSFALSAYLLDKVMDGIDATEWKHDSVDDYLRDIQNFFLFISYVGHIRDMMEDISSERALRDPSILSPFDSYYGLRSHALHAARIPLARDDVGLKVPAISFREKKDGEYNDDALWDEADPKKFVYFGDFCREVHKGLFSEMVKVLGLIHSKAIERFGRVIEPSMPIKMTMLSTGSNYRIEFPISSPARDEKVEVEFRIYPSGEAFPRS